MLNYHKEVMSVEKLHEGTVNGIEYYKIRLQSEQVRMVITNIGCTIVSIHTPDRNGNWKNVVAGFANLDDYRNNEHYFGCVVGRYANRIAGGRFSLNGQDIQLSQNDGPNHLHGGFKGFHAKVWEVTAIINDNDKVGVEFQYDSPDGEEGFPGNLTVRIKYLLTRQNELVIEYAAVTDKSTPLCLTNHSYFNMTGFEHTDIYEHVLHINALHYTENDEEGIPTGSMPELAGTPLDFYRAKKIGTDLHRFQADEGLNHNYILSGANGGVRLAAELTDECTGRSLKVFTDQKGLQVYTANLWNGSVRGEQGVPYIKHGAVALETQAFPDSPNHPLFPDTILNPGEEYHSTTIYVFNA